VYSLVLPLLVYFRFFLACPFYFHYNQAVGELNMITLPKSYHQYLSVVESQMAIKAIKDLFEDKLSMALNLVRVSAPLFVGKNSGINDDLSGFEKAVDFKHGEIDDTLEIVHSLAKWKRLALSRYGFSINQGLYTDMNAIRKHEVLDGIHSILVDQWDWELVIDENERTLEKLQHVVNDIYDVLLLVESMLEDTFNIQSSLAKKVTFISSYDLEKKYPKLSPKEREYVFAKEHGTIFITEIGDILSNGDVHDNRSPDYDDWQLNGDLLVYYPLLDAAIELSSMGIRVNSQSMEAQCQKANAGERLTREFHKLCLNNKLPHTIGGGIGQSRMCLILLHKAHIGEVQASTWPTSMINACTEKGIFLL
jgi:aspartate--ammonia ligase